MRLHVPRLQPPSPRSSSFSAHRSRPAAGWKLATDPVRWYAAVVDALGAAQYDASRAVRAVAFRTRRTEERDNRHAQRCGKVHRPGHLHRRRDSRAESTQSSSPTEPITGSRGAVTRLMHGVGQRLLARTVVDDHGQSQTAAAQPPQCRMIPSASTSRPSQHRDSRSRIAGRRSARGFDRPSLPRRDQRELRRHVVERLACELRDDG